MPSALRISLLLLALCALPLRAQPPRLVFAHYMLANRDYAPNDPSGELDISAYQREIRQAQSIGIDGFALNAGGWFKEPRYIRRASEMFEAAVRLHSGFRLFFSADMCCSNDAADVEDMVRRFANKPRYAPVYFRHNGKFLLTTFAGSSHGPDFWRTVRTDLEHGTNPSTREAPCLGDLCTLAPARPTPSNAPLPLEFVPAFFFGGELPHPADISAGLATYRDIIDGAFYWGIAGVPGLGHSPDQLPSSEAYATALHAAGKIYMAPICFQFWGANANRYYEYSGFSGMRAMWRQAIQTTHPDWIEIITWNDFVEGTYVSPIDDPTSYPHASDLGLNKADASHYFHSHRGAAELLTYFIQWYKSGREPIIHTDTVFWAYRTQPSGAPASIRTYGPVTDAIYFTANLTAPATLRVTFGKQVKSIQLTAGSTDIQVPFTTGYAPHIELFRNATAIASADGDDIVSPTANEPNFYYSTGSVHAQTRKRAFPRQ